MELVMVQGYELTLASVGCSLIKLTNSEHQSLVSVIGSSINQCKQLAELDSLLVDNCR